MNWLNIIEQTTQIIVLNVKDLIVNRFKWWSWNGEGRGGNCDCACCRAVCFKVTGSNLRNIFVPFALLQSWTSLCVFSTTTAVVSFEVTLVFQCSISVKKFYVEMNYESQVYEYVSSSSVSDTDVFQLLKLLVKYNDCWWKKLIWTQKLLIEQLTGSCIKLLLSGLFALLWIVWYIGWF